MTEQEKNKLESLFSNALDKIATKEERFVENKPNAKRLLQALKAGR